MSSRRLMLLALLLGLALFAASCGDDNPTDPVGDTTAPLVVSVSPSHDDDNVSLDETLVISFNEDMDAASAAGHVTLSHGTVTGTSWTNARTLAVTHTDWPEGTEVTATATVGLTDEAGNALAQAFPWQFWTWTDEVILLNTTPDDDATGVSINTTIWLQFSQSMNGDTLPGAITVTSPDKLVHAYTLGSPESESEWVLTFVDNLPASTLITVAVSTNAESSDGTPLAEAASFSFTTGTNTDHEPPLIVSVSPSQDDDDVSLDETLVISFNEDMDAASAAGHVTLSHGTVTGTSWTNARTLAVTHTGWPEGTEVTATATVGLTDEAGNALAQAFAWQFWTWTDEVLLLNTAPADAAAGVPVNTTVWLQFSQSMNGGTLPGAITVTSPDKTVHAYTLDSPESDSEWILTFVDDLPGSTLITVAVSTDAENWAGTPLAEATSFSFTTGTGADLTPPQLVSVEPADGAVIGTDVNFFRLTFNEPIDDNSLNPAMISGQLMASMATMDNPGVWSENNTVMTVGLRTPLIPGSILRVEFLSFADVNGNVNDDGFDWQATVAGTAQFYPVVDGWARYLAGYYEETDHAKTSGFVGELQVIEVKTGGEFWLWHTENRNYDPAKDLPEMEEYDRMKVTTSAIQLLGFHEVRDMESSDMTFAPPLDWLRLPVQAGSWSGTSTFDEGEDEMQVDYEASILAGTYDVPMGSMDRKQDDGPPVIWLGCRKMTLNYELSDGVDVFSAGSDTLWYAPGAGLVREINHEVQQERTYHTDKTLMWVGFESDWPSR